jgi:hypothetical protein
VVVVSSRTPEGDPNRCAVCGHSCKVEPSSLSPDAPCPSCGHLLWFPAKGHKPKRETASAARTKRIQNPPTAREPQVQAERLIARLIRRAVGRLGSPDGATATVLAEVKVPRQAERLLSLLHAASSWGELVAMWRAEQMQAEPV